MTDVPQQPHPDPDEQAHQALTDSDAGLARVVEDLIDVLIQRGLVQFTDFPPAAQAKLLQRRQTRATLSQRLNLLDDGDGLM